MKKYLFCIQILLATHAFSQVSDTLLPNYYGGWDIITWQYDGWTTSGGDYNSYLIETYDSLPWNGTTWTYFSVFDYDGLLRSDSGKVYCRGWFEQLPFPLAPPDTSEAVLYDFTMEVGDTAYMDESWPVTVESIGTSNLLGVPKKTWFLSDGETIVQGLGSSKGLFRPWTILFESNNWICSFDGYYKDTAGNITELHFSTVACNFSEIEEESTTAVSAICGPEQIRISSEREEALKIFTYDGRLVYQSNLTSGETMLDINFLASGMYILQIGTDYFQKFIRT